jgi:hypothetical protein
MHSEIACLVMLCVCMLQVFVNVLILWCLPIHFLFVQKKKPTSEKRKTNLELFKEELKMLVTLNFCINNIWNKRRPVSERKHI